MANYTKILATFYPQKKWGAFENCSYEQIEWLDSEEKPSQEELDSLEFRVVVEEAKVNRLASRKAYLADKDRYWIRKLRENIDVPEEIVKKSNQARAEIRSIKVATTLAEVESYSEVFE